MIIECFLCHTVEKRAHGFGVGGGGSTLKEKGRTSKISTCKEKEIGLFGHSVFFMLLTDIDSMLSMCLCNV